MNLPMARRVCAHRTSKFKPYLAALAYRPARMDEIIAAGVIRFTHSWQVPWLVRKKTRMGYKESND